MGFGRGSRARCGLSYIWTAHGALGRVRCTVHPQAVTAGDGTRGTRPSPHLDGLYADALRRGTRSRCSPRAYRRAVELGPEGVGSSRGDGSAGLCPTWQRSQRRDTERWAAWGRIPAKRFAASRSASLRFDGLYIDASRSNPRTLSAPLWRIGRLRDFRAENVSQAIATSHGSEDERFDGGQRARPASRICDMRSSRPCRGRKGTFGRAQQGFIDSSIESCAGLFRLYAQRGELNHQPPIPLGSLYSGKPPCSIPEPPPFLDHKKREAVQMEQGGDFNMTSFRGAP